MQLIPKPIHSDFTDVEVTLPPSPCSRSLRSQCSGSPLCSLPCPSFPRILALTVLPVWPSKAFAGYAANWRPFSNEHISGAWNEVFQKFLSYYLIINTFSILRNIRSIDPFDLCLKFRARIRRKEREYRSRSRIVEWGECIPELIRNTHTDKSSHILPCWPRRTKRL